LIHRLIELHQALLMGLAQLVELLIVHVELAPRAWVHEKRPPERVIEIKIVSGISRRNELLLSWCVARILNLGAGLSGCTGLAPAAPAPPDAPAAPAPPEAPAPPPDRAVCDHAVAPMHAASAPAAANV
jgi:hypothetical protein